MDENQEQDPVKIRRSTYNKERYEANKDSIFEISQGTVCFLKLKTI